MNVFTGRAKQVIVPATLSISVFFVYMYYHSPLLVGDGLTWVVHTLTRSELFWHPHHLLYSPMLAVLFSICRVDTIDSAIRVSQIINSAAAVAGCLGVYVFIFQQTKSKTFASYAFLFLAVTRGFWYFSNGDIHPLATSLLIWAFVLHRKSVVAVLLFSLAILFHQENVLFTPVLVYLWGYRSIKLVGLSAIIVMTAYICAYMRVSTNDSMLTWLTSYMHNEMADTWYPRHS